MGVDSPAQTGLRRDCARLWGDSRAYQGTVIRHIDPDFLRTDYCALTSHTTTTPTIAEPMPIKRRVASGVSSTLCMARLACAGKAANTRPSITNTSPSAAKKSDIQIGRAHV